MKLQIFRARSLEMTEKWQEWDFWPALTSLKIIRSSVATSHGHMVTLINLHANVSVSVVELHLSASLDPSDHPGLMARDGRHDHQGKGLEVWRPVAQHYGWVLFDHRGALVDGGRHVTHGDVLAFDPRLAAEALDAAHGRKARFELDPRICISVG